MILAVDKSYYLHYSLSLLNVVDDTQKFFHCHTIVDKGAVSFPLAVRKNSLDVFLLEENELII